MKEFFVSVSGHLRNSKDQWLVTGVYGLCISEWKASFFQELSDIRVAWNRPWCIYGDFNEVLSLEDRNGESFFTGGMGFFADLVNSHGLRDVPISGAEYTWSNMQLNPSLSKLDRFLLYPEWDASFPFSKGLAQPIPMSDHIPIVLCGKMPRGNPSLSSLKTCG